MDKQPNVFLQGTWIKGLILAIAVFSLSFTARAGLPEGDLLDGVAPGPDGKIDVLTVFAHQDDETIIGGTLIKLKKDPRVRLTLMCLTLGDATPAKDKLGIDPEYMGRIRVAELAAAAVVYGADNIIQLDYHDQGLPSADHDQMVSDILDAIEQTGAEVVITFGPEGVTAHPDHMVCSKVATAAFKKSNAGILYYTTLSPRLHDLPYRFAGPKDDPESRPIEPQFKVDIRAEKKLKRMAMYAHASQHEFTYIGTLMEIVRRFDYEYFIKTDVR